MSNLQDNKPFTDDDIPSVIASVTADPLFPMIVRYIYPDKKIDEVRQFMSTITTVHDLQHKVMRVNMDRMLTACQSTFTYHISPRLQHDQSYLFVSNHRDIILDAMLLQCALCDEHYETSQIVFGTNLLTLPLMNTIGRANKMVAIERGGSPREFYNNLNILSHYIRSVITEQHESMWIAQGNGRSKNGHDTTDPAIIKMFAMSSRSPLSEAIAQLRPVPVTISYEIEPCDYMKANELALRQSCGTYQKQPNEDYLSVLQGITQHKGHIHLHVGDPIDNADLLSCDNDPRAVASLFDHAINSHYQLHPINYVAHDQRSSSQRYASHYTTTDVDQFQQRLSTLDLLIDTHAPSMTADQRHSARAILTDIYANPVDSLQDATPANIN